MNTVLKPIKTLSMLNLLMKESVLHEGILNIFNDLIKTLDIRLNKKWFQSIAILSSLTHTKKYRKFTNLGKEYTALLLGL